MISFGSTLKLTRLLDSMDKRGSRSVNRPPPLPPTSCSTLVRCHHHHHRSQCSSEQMGCDEKMMMQMIMVLISEYILSTCCSVEGTTKMSHGEHADRGAHSRHGEERTDPTTSCHVRFWISRIWKQHLTTSTPPTGELGWGSIPEFYCYIQFGIPSINLLPRPPLHFIPNPYITNVRFRSSNQIKFSKFNLGFVHVSTTHPPPQFTSKTQQPPQGTWAHCRHGIKWTKYTTRILTVIRSPIDIIWIRGRI